MPAFEKVACRCPPYKGSDFWNDPHRWCGVDAPKQAFWMKEEPSDCERTVRPKKALPVPYNPYRNVTPTELQDYYWRMQNNLQLQQQHFQQNSYLGPGVGLFGNLLGL